jgi:LuxR family maltose regulon positive regulatory protein
LAAALALARADWPVDDVGTAVADAEAALAAATDSTAPMYVVARVALGQALYLAGRPVEAEAILEAALRAPGTQQHPGMGRAPGLLALVSLALGKEERAADLARRAVQAVEESGQEMLSTRWYGYAALGQVLVREGRLEEARAVLARGVEPHLEWMEAWPLRYALALVALVTLDQRQGDLALARARLEAAKAAIHGCRDAGMLPALVVELERGLLRPATGTVGLQEQLSEGELRVLRLLGSELTQREIGHELYLSLNTVKSHARAIYGKLGVSSRPEAVVRARALGLIGAAAAARRSDRREPAPEW